MCYFNNFIGDTADTILLHTPGICANLTQPKLPFENKIWALIQELSRHVGQFVRVWTKTYTYEEPTEVFSWKRKF